MKTFFKLLFLIPLLAFSFLGKAVNTSISYDDVDVVAMKDIHHLFALDSSVVEVSDTIIDGVKKVKFKRGKAIIFCVLTGLLGGHRIYLGTHQRTPIIYSLTLGGLGILPLVDLIHIIFTKDLSKFENKPETIMWKK